MFCRLHTLSLLEKKESEGEKKTTLNLSELSPPFFRPFSYKRTPRFAPSESTLCVQWSGGRLFTIPRRWMSFLDCIPFLIKDRRLCSFYCFHTSVFYSGMFLEQVAHLVWGINNALTHVFIVMCQLIVGVLLVYYGIQPMFWETKQPKKKNLCDCVNILSANQISSRAVAPFGNSVTLTTGGRKTRATRRSWSFYVPTLTFGRWLWVATKRSHIQDMKFLWRVAELSLRDRMRSSAIRTELGVVRGVPGRPWGRTCWRDEISRPAREHLRVN